MTIPAERDQQPCACSQQILLTHVRLGHQPTTTCIDCPQPTPWTHARSSARAQQAHCRLHSSCPAVEAARLPTLATRSGGCSKMPRQWCDENSRRGTKCSGQCMDEHLLHSVSGPTCSQMLVRRLRQPLSISHFAHLARDHRESGQNPGGVRT